MDCVRDRRHQWFKAEEQNDLICISVAFSSMGEHLLRRMMALRFDYRHRSKGGDVNWGGLCQVSGLEKIRKGNVESCCGCRMGVVASNTFWDTVILETLMLTGRTYCSCRVAAKQVPILLGHSWSYRSWWHPAFSHHSSSLKHSHVTSLVFSSVFTRKVARSRRVLFKLNC